MRHNLKILIHILGGPLTNVCSESCPFCSWSFVRCWLADTQAGGIQAVCESVGKTMRSVKNNSFLKGLSGDNNVAVS